MKRLSQTLKAGLAVFLAVFSSGLIQLYTAPNASAYTAPTEEPITQVMICHARKGSKPYGPGNKQTVSINSAGELQGGHNDHTGNGQVWSPTNTTNFSDIIPPFYYLDGNGVKQHSSGLGWSTEGQLIYANNCSTEGIVYIAPFVAAEPVACIAGTNNTDDLRVTITNTNDLSNLANTYTLTVIKDGVAVPGYTQIVGPIAEGASSDAILFKGLAAGEYVIQVTSENEPTVTKNVTVGQCAEETPKYFLQTSHATTCGQVTISLRNVSPWLYRVLIEEKVGNNWVRVGASTGDPKWQAAPGVMIVDNRGEAPDDQTGSYIVQFAEDSGNGLREVRYRVSSGAEADLYVGLPVGEFTHVQVDTDCLSPLPSTAKWLHELCLADSNTTDLLQVLITNTADETEEDVTYTVTATPSIGVAISKTVTIADGEESTLDFANLPAGKYTLTIEASDGTVFNPITLTVEQCTMNPGSGSGGHVDGEAATDTKLPATIPATGAVDSGNPFLVLTASLVAYGATFFLQKRRELSTSRS